MTRLPVSKILMIVAALLVLALVVTSCGGTDEETSEPTQVAQVEQAAPDAQAPEGEPTPAPESPAEEPAPAPEPAVQPVAAGEPALEGTNWLAESYLGDQGEMVAAIAGAEPSALFADGTVGGTTGCNNYSASYELSGDQLTIMPGPLTMMACPEPLMAQEAGYLAALGSAASYAIEGGKLQIADADGNTVLAYAVLEPVSLTGTNWQLTGYNNGKGGFSSVLAGTEITALFGDDGSMVGSAGCNAYTATFAVEDNGLVIGPAAATRMMCGEPEGIMEQEGAYLAATQSVITFEIVGDALTLYDAEGVRYLSYTAAQEGEASTEAAYEPQVVTPDVVANLTYMSAFTASGEVTLVDGAYSEPAAPGSATQTMVQLTEYQAYFPLDDGEEGAAVVLVTDPGGSGTFYDLALVTSQDGDVANVASVPLGDRIRVNSIAVESGAIVLDMVVHAPDDPMCCPTQQVIQTYVVRGGELVEGSRTVVGTVESGAGEESAAGEAEAAPAGEADFPRVVWKLVEFHPADGEVVTVEQPDLYTLELVSDVRISVRADCNRGGGAYEVIGDQVSINITTMTMALCGPESLSEAFVDGLNAATSFEVQDDALVLYADDGLAMTFMQE